MRKCCRAPVPTSDILLANSLMRLLDAHLDAWRDTGDKDDKNYVPKPPPDAKKGGELLQGLFVFCLIWCVGATVDDAGRAKFDAFLRALLKREAPPWPLTITLTLTPTPTPTPHNTVTRCEWIQTAMRMHHELGSSRVGLGALGL